jgi:F-type H+-transporting ATPase subunit b
MTGHEVHHPVITDLIKPAVNFSLFAALIVYAVRGPIRTFLRDRTERIRSALEAGQRAKREAEELRAQIGRDTADLPGIRARMVGEMRETAERERALLLEKAAQTAERIRLDAKLTGQQEAEAARSELRIATIEQAVAEAARLVRQAITPDDQHRAVEEFVQSARTL